MKNVCIIAVVALLSIPVLATDTYTATTPYLDVQGGYFQLPGYGSTYKGNTYIDVQTRISSFAYWGLLRWDLTAVKQELNDNLGGLGNWEVTKVELTMYRTRYTNSASGNVDVRFTTDDVTNFLTLKNATDGYSDPIDGQLVYGVNSNGDPNTSGTFLKTIYYENEGTNYVPLTYTLYDAAVDANSATEGQLMLINDIIFDNKTTLCFVDNANDYFVSAAWAGPGTNYYGQQPVLTITVKMVDEPIKVCVDRPRFDITGPEGVPDCKVDLFDLAEFAAEWLTCGYANPGDCLL